jgi:hypothetical protein
VSLYFKEQLFNAVKTVTNYYSESHKTSKYPLWTKKYLTLNQKVHIIIILLSFIDCYVVSVK